MWGGLTLAKHIISRVSDLMWWRSGCRNTCVWRTRRRREMQERSELEGRSCCDAQCLGVIRCWQVRQDSGIISGLMRLETMAHTHVPNARNISEGKKTLKWSVSSVWTGKINDYFKEQYRFFYDNISVTIILPHSQECCCYNDIRTNQKTHSFWDVYRTQTNDCCVWQIQIYIIYKVLFIYIIDILLKNIY